MMQRAIILVLVALAGVATAAPALARDVEASPPCPEMPTSNNHTASRDGGASLSFGGFGVSGTRARTTTTTDTMIGAGWSFEAWSAAVELAHACAIIRKQYPYDFERQRREFSVTRSALLGRVPLPSTPSSRTQYGSIAVARQSGTAAVSYPSTPQISRIRNPGSLEWTFDELWKSRPALSVPFAALLKGLSQATADVECTLGRREGLSNCVVLAESAAGLGLGSGAVVYLQKLELTDEVADAEWRDRRLRIQVVFGGR